MASSISKPTARDSAINVIMLIEKPIAYIKINPPSSELGSASPVIKVDFADPKVTKLGTFYKAAPYIVYRGDDKARAWKVMSDYTNEYEKKGVDDVCDRMNRTANQDSTGYRITKYFTEKESEGTWHILMVSYKKKGVEKSAAFAFLKIGNRFGLGDID